MPLQPHGSEQKELKAMEKEKQFIPERQVIERLGVVMEKMEIPPVHARIFVLLLMVNPPYMSFEEIQEYLQVSKSSVSKYINSMLENGTLDYKTFSGDRKRYFFLNYDKLLNKILTGASKFTIISNLMENCLVEREKIVSPDKNQQLCELAEFFKFMGDGMADLVTQYMEKKNNETQNESN